MTLCNVTESNILLLPLGGLQHMSTNVILCFSVILMLHHDDSSNVILVSVCLAINDLSCI